MWNLEKPDLQKSINDLNDIQNHSRLLDSSHIPAIVELYHQYDNQKGIVTEEQHNTIEENAQDGLYAAYGKTHRSGEHSSIRDEISNGINKCPFCSVGNANTLDHFMEKSKFKALSMMRQNLVPMCRDCNSNRQYNKIEAANFIHAYYDILPTDKQWLKVDIKYLSGAIYANFYPDKNVLTDPILFNKVSNTIKGIEFNITIRKELHAFLSSTLSGSISSSRILRAIIHDKANYHMNNNNFGLNHWKTVLLMELASNPTITKEQLSLYL